MPRLGGLMKTTGNPYQWWEPKKKRWLWYVDGEIRSLYPDARSSAPTSPLNVPGEVIAAGSRWGRASTTEEGAEAVPLW